MWRGFGRPRLFGILAVAFYRGRHRPRRSARRLGLDHVYVIKGEHGRVKIGSSGDPHQRCADLQTGSPDRLWVEHVAITNGPAEPVEREAHAMLDRHRLNGEWFAVPTEVAVATIAAAAHRLGVEITTGEADAFHETPRLSLTMLFCTALAASIPFWALSALAGPVGSLPYLVLALCAVCLGILSGRLAPDRGFAGGARYLATLFAGALVGAPLVLSVLT